eukprot:gene8900-18418_t
MSIKSGSSLYVRGRFLGEGTWGTVFEATRKSDNRRVGVKLIKLSKEAKQGVAFTALREVKYLQELKHINVIELLDVYLADKCLHLVFEFCPTDLEVVIKAKQDLFISPADVKSYMIMLLSGLKYCHEHFILHRDLKPSNLLIAYNGQLRVGDFGLAREFGSPNRSMSNQVVTTWYRAPELLFGARRYSTAIDQWAVGCIFAEIILRTPIFTGTTDIDQLAKIFNVIGTPNVDNWAGATVLPNFVDFEPREPLDLVTASNGITTALNHPYFTNEPSPTPPEKLPVPYDKTSAQHYMYINSSSNVSSNGNIKIEVKREMECVNSSSNSYYPPAKMMKII